MNENILISFGLLFCLFLIVASDSEAILCSECPAKCPSPPFCIPNINAGLGYCSCFSLNLNQRNGFGNSVIASASSAINSGNLNGEGNTYSSSSVFEKNGKVYATNANERGVKITQPCEECQRKTPQACNTSCIPDPLYGPGSCSCTGPPTQELSFNYGY